MWTLRPGRRGQTRDGESMPDWESRNQAMADVIIHAEAEAEYEAALAWYSARSAREAAGFAVAVDQAIAKVAQNPTLYPACDEAHRHCLLRRYPYALVYRVDGDRVLVVAVPHDRQLPGFWRGRA